MGSTQAYINIFDLELEIKISLLIRLSFLFSFLYVDH